MVGSSRLNFKSLIQHGAVDLLKASKLVKNKSKSRTTKTSKSNHTSTPTCLSCMTLESYGRGYLLKPPSDHNSYGEKYFLDGWWMDSKQGWFFKSQHKDSLISMGATFLSEAVFVDDNHDNSQASDHESHQDHDLSGMTIQDVVRICS